MRKNLGILGLRRFAFVLLLAASGPLMGWRQMFAQTSETGTISTTKSEPTFQLKVRSNLVVVRVVVRDTEGKPVEGLRKEDFRLFDRGKEQSISQFEGEAPSPPPLTSTGPVAPGQTALAPPPAMPSNFLALYFDDLNTSDMDMVYAREAADHYLAANLQPKDRAAIFTSDQMLSDFAVDPQQIHTDG